MKKILQADLAGKGVIGLPDTPRLTAEEMQRKFEETAREVIIPKYNALVDELSGDSGAEGIGAKDPAGEKTTVQKELDNLHKDVELAQETGEKAGEEAQTAALAATEAKTAAEEAKAAAEEANIITEFKQLTAEQRETARNNIFAVSCEADQGLGASLRHNARANIKAVSYEAAMPTTLTEEEKAQARANIGAAAVGDTGANVEEAINTALEQAKASGEFDGEKGEDGEPGKDGVSATHKWEGTTLTITSASGTSSANLKGDKGDTGAQGAKGADGQPGKDGADGKSAYQYAVDAGYTGTEEEFAKVLASGGTGGSGVETETVLSDNLLDKSLMTKGGVWYYGSSGIQLTGTSESYSYYGFIPLRGAGTYRTKFQAKVHESTSKRIALVDDNDTFVVNVIGSHGEIPDDETRNWLDFEFVVTQEHIAAGAAKVAFDVYSLYYDQTMIVKDREYPSEFIPFGYIEVATDSGRKQNNVLCEKTAVFLGDSICAGTTVGTDSEYYGYGWAGLIGEANRMNWKNYGKNGGTITHRGADSTCIAKIADTAIAEHPNADYVIFEGGCNDADQMKDAGLGEISADYATFDTTTFSGALEALILKLVTAYPHAKIGYIIPQKMYTGYADFTAKNHIHRKYFDRAVEICQKWGIPVVDIWNGSMLNPKLSTASVYYSDGIQHLSEAGYLAITPMIEAWMRNMYVPGTAAGGSGGVTSWNDLTDKPFGESDNAVLLPPTQFVGGLIANALVALGSNIELVDGRTYTVNWNGVDYEAVCYMAKTSFAEEKVPVVGNPLPQGGEDNGLPFVIGGNEQGVMAWPLDGSTGATVSIKGYRIEPIPVKYLPKVSDLDATWLAELKTALGISE